MFKAVIFDLDGTLLDSLDDILFVLNGTLSHFGLPEINRSQAQAFIGNGARELVRLAIGKQNERRLDEILAYYKEKYAKSDNSLARLYPYEEQCLQYLKANNIKIAILTNKPHTAAVTAENIFFRQFRFDAVLGQVDGIAQKPDPSGAFTILERLGVTTAEALFVGDGETDVVTAENAGMVCASVLWGYRTKAQLLSAGATNFVSNFKELEQFILG